MDSIKGLWIWLIGLLFLVVLFALFTAGMKAVAAIIEILLPTEIKISTLLAPFCVIILAPLGAFQRTRRVAANGLRLASYWFGIGAWLYSFMVTFAIWGALGLLIGLICFGVGVIPLAMLAATVKGHWTDLVDIIYFLFLAIAARGVSMFLFSRLHAVSTKTIDLSPEDWSVRHDR